MVSVQSEGQGAQGTAPWGAGAEAEGCGDVRAHPDPLGGN